MNLFDDLIGSVNSICKYCTNDDAPDASITHFHKTEFFNEGWMLKLFIARLMDDSLYGVLPDDMAIIRSAARKGWMSEGRLSAAFTNEQCTHADAILGDIVVSEKSKWGVTISKNNPSLFVVVEAKLGSKLASRTTNAPSFNQAARNIACMALALHQASAYLPEKFDAHFFVILPERGDIRDAENKVKSAHQVIADEIKARNSRHRLRESLIQPGEIVHQLKKIKPHVITWDYAIRALSSRVCDERTRMLKTFYDSACDAAGFYPLRQRRGAHSSRC